MAIEESYAGDDRERTDETERSASEHSLHGIILAQGPHIRHNEKIEKANIIDVAPTVLYALDMPIPTDMDGKPLTAIFEQAHVDQTEASYTDERKVDEIASDQYSDEYGYSEEEEESVRLKLEALGYL